MIELDRFVCFVTVQSDLQHNGELRIKRYTPEEDGR